MLYSMVHKIHLFDCDVFGSPWKSCHELGRLKVRKFGNIECEKQCKVCVTERPRDRLLL